MGRLNYSVPSEKDTSAKAMASELHISFKKTREICHYIQGMKVGQAKAVLENVVIMKQAVPFKRHHDGSGHRKGPMANGRYPVNAAIEVLKLIKNAEGNAEYKGLEPANMRITTIHANRGRVIRGMFPRARGRASPKNTTTVNIELIISEVQ